MVREKKKIVREQKLYSDSDLVDAHIEKDEDGNDLVMCGVCYTPFNGEIDKYPQLDYGEDADGVWFIRKCTCGVPSKYYVSMILGEKRRWSHKRKTPTKIVVKSITKKVTPVKKVEALYVIQSSFEKAMAEKAVKPVTPPVKKVISMKSLGQNWWGK